MDREPSIHVTRSVFLSIVKDLGIKLSKPNLDRIMKAARELSADNRTMIAKANQTRQVRKTEGTIKEANLVAEIIYGIRVKLRHVGVTKIKQSDSTWGQVRELVPTLNQFCEKYSLTQRRGYIDFITVGIELMSKSKRANYNYCASWMLKHADYITSTYEANNMVKEDPYPQNTRELLSLYQTRVMEMSGMYVDYTQNTKEYTHFIGARQLADKWGIDYETFVDAQFASLEFCKGIPRIYDLDNEKAEQRLAQYIAKNGIQVHRSAIQESTWDDFKK